MKNKKLYWWQDGLLFYSVGYNYSISGQIFIVKRFWKWSNSAKEKAIKLAVFLSENK